MSTYSIAIDPVSGIRSSRRSSMITLASSRATSQRITSPSGLRAAPASRITLHDRGRRLEQLHHAAGAVRRGATIAEVDHGSSASLTRVRDRRLAALLRLHEHVPQLRLGERLLAARVIRMAVVIPVVPSRVTVASTSISSSKRAGAR